MTRVFAFLGETLLHKYRCNGVSTTVTSNIYVSMSVSLGEKVDCAKTVQDRPFWGDTHPKPGNMASHCEAAAYHRNSSPMEHKFVLRGIGEVINWLSIGVVSDPQFSSKPPKLRQTQHPMAAKFVFQHVAKLTVSSKIRVTLQLVLMNNSAIIRKRSRLPLLLSSGDRSRDLTASHSTWLRNPVYHNGLSANRK